MENELDNKRLVDFLWKTIAIEGYKNEINTCVIISFMSYGFSIIMIYINFYFFLLFFIASLGFFFLTFRIKNKQEKLELKYIEAYPIEIDTKLKTALNKK